MLRSCRRFMGTVAQASDLSTRMAALQSKLAQHLPVSTADLSARDLSPKRELTMDERLALLDSKVANLEALRQAGLPEEERIKNLPNKYGRAGRFPAYPWYGKYVKPEDRLPHVSDRLGKYSTVAPAENELTQFFQFHSDLNNPMFQSFFVQEPNREPDRDLDFEYGDVIYENPDAASGVSLVRQLGTAFFAYFAFNCIHVFSTGRATYPIGNEFCDVRQEVRNSKNSFLVAMLNWGDGWHTLHNFYLIAFIMPILPLGVLAYTLAIKGATEDQVVKMRYNKDKELIFITKMKGMFFTKTYEEVYEAAHLQVLPPYVRTFDDTTKDKLLTINCMASGDSFIVYKDEKYWNPSYSMEFKKHLHSMWS